MPKGSNPKIKKSNQTDWFSKLAVLLNRNRWFWIYSILVLTISFFTYYWNYDQPAAPYWDENFHIASAQKYVEGDFFVELHPPLGKMLIAAGEKIWQPNENENIKNESGNGPEIFAETDYIGDPTETSFPKNYSFVGVRFFPALLAFLSGYLFFLLLFVIAKNPHLAFLFSSFFLFDNAMIVHMRGAMLEGIQMFFVLLSLIYFAYAWQGGKITKKSFLILGALIGFALSVKINSAVLLLLFIPLVWKYLEIKPIKNWSSKLVFDKLKKLVLPAFSFGLGLILIFGFFQWLHLQIASEVTNYRDYDISDDFLRDVEEGKTLSPINAWRMSKEWYLYQENYNKGVPELDVTKEGENGSFPLNWIVGKKAINYRWERYAIQKDKHSTYLQKDNLEPYKIGLEQRANLPDEEKENYVVPVKYLYAQSNPISWYIALISLVLVFSLVIGNLIYGYKVWDKETYNWILVFTSLYVFYFVAVLSVQRVLYLYHYFIPLVLSFVLTMLIFKYFTYQDLKNPKLAVRVYSFLGVIALLVYFAFIFFAPLTYYLPMTTEEFEQRVWFDFWGLEAVK